MKHKQLFALLISIYLVGIISSVWGDDSSQSGDGTKVDADPAQSKKGSMTDGEAVAREEEAIKLDGLNVAQMKELRDKAEKHHFQAEVDRMMKLIINSLYKNKEIFLRELISNASDALDKIRFLSLTDTAAMGATEELSIRIKANKESKSLHVTDTGIGMTHDDLIKNLGTIAKSGTADFLDKLSSSNNQNEASDLIGQFGVGFYSSFLVADRVTVVSKHNDDDQYIWESDTKEFTITKDPRGNTLKRGTEIILHLKDETMDYLEVESIRGLIQKYSQFINFPIYLWASKTEMVDEEPAKDATPEPEKKEDDATVEEEKEKEKETKKVEKTVWDWELINQNKPIWSRKPSEVKDEEYTEFFKAFTKSSDAPMDKIHFTAEGEVTFKSILYIPKTAPFDLFNQQKAPNNIKLFVRRVFITDDVQDIMPRYLSFVSGIVDSDDLPLNVSRETLQQHKLLKVIKKKLVRKTLDMIKKLSKEDFATFWKEFSTNLKLGVIEDTSNRTRLAKLIRFWSSHSETDQTTLSEYLGRMKPKQDLIYFVAGQGKDEVKNSPFVERLLKKGYEVLYLIEPVDEYTIQALPEFEGKKFQNVAKEGVKLDSSDKAKERKEAMEKSFEPLIKWMKEDALKDFVEKVEISERLTTSPCALVANTYGWSGNMERIMRAQAYQKTEDPQQSFYANQKKILEINPRHPLIKELKQRVESAKDDPTTKDLATVLFETATLRSGYLVKDTASFSERIEKMLRLSMNIDLNEQVEEEEMDDEEEVATPKSTEDGEELLNKKTDEDMEDKAEDSSEDDNDCPTCRKLLGISKKPSKQKHRSRDDDDDDDEEEEEEEMAKKSKKSAKKQPKKKKKHVVIVEEEDDEEEPEIEEEEEDELPQARFKKSKFPRETEEEDEDEEESDEILAARQMTSIPGDHDCDGIPDEEDEDVDNDGLLDRTQDSDWDGSLNHLDEDDDDDGIPDVDDPDSNGDGYPDCRHDVSDIERKIRFKGKQKGEDKDQDGIEDDFDHDDDENGIPDILEDKDGDQIPDLLYQHGEIDEDGMYDLMQNPKLSKWKDHDCDGIPDHLDPDDDNDGYFDKKQDSDKDGDLNEYDEDDDNDGIPDEEDEDSNGDGIPDCVVQDSDDDGIPDHIDTDDDNDGIHDLKDPDHRLFDFFRDKDNDGISDSMDNDNDNDGIPDKWDKDSDGDGVNDLFPDQDGDGIPDTIDNDMDNDGIMDHLQDHDCDGIPDLIDPDDDNDGFFDNKQDSDKDGSLNAYDDDDDNDGIDDRDDDDSNGDGVIDCVPIDMDEDGIPDHLDPDDDNDGIPDYLDPDSMAFLIYKNTQKMEAIPAADAADQANMDDGDLGDEGDKDCDGIPDEEDADMDNDGKFDRTQDSDWDGTMNHLDEDDDNDGLIDVKDPDSNGDGVPDCRRDQTVEYQLVKTAKGGYQVIRIKKLDEEDEKMETLKREASPKLIRVKAVLKPIKVNVDIPAAEDEKEEKETAPEVKAKSKSTKKDIKGKSTKTSKESKDEEVEDEKPPGKGTKSKKPEVKAKEKDSEPPCIKKPAANKKAAATLKIKKPVKVEEVEEEEDEEDVEEPPVVKKGKAGKKEKEEKPSKNKRKLLETKSEDDSDENDEDEENQILESAEEEEETVPKPVKEKVKVSKKSQSKASEKESTPQKKVGHKPKTEVKKEPAKRSSGGIIGVEAVNDAMIKKAAILKRQAEKEAMEAVEDEEDSENVEENEEEDEGYHEDVETVEESADDETDASEEEVELEEESDDGVAVESESTQRVSRLGQEDKDGDGIPDFEADVDGNQISDRLEELDSDKDGKMDFIDDDDDDNDGTPDMSDNDDDGDNVEDKLEDENKNWIPDILERGDADDDGIPDFLDIDDDNDGIPDSQDDDIDNNGVLNRFEDKNQNKLLDFLECKDTDGDGIPDYLDDDDDNDGVPDSEDEDDDNDGILDEDEDENENEIPDSLELEDSDGDGFIDLIDMDDDNDGVDDHLDMDSDGDGIKDTDEDENGNGIPDAIERANKKKLHQYINTTARSLIFKTKDTDKDGVPDYLDTDDDNDGMKDEEDDDDDGDGVLDKDEDENQNKVPDYLEMKDSDDDDIPDLFDVDDDNDGIPDEEDSDRDGDGILNELEDENENGIPDQEELNQRAGTEEGEKLAKYSDTNQNKVPDYLELKDSDNDQIIDLLDTDDDNDGITDDEDDDSDGDGVSNSEEDENRNLIPDTTELLDEDGDGVPDILGDVNIQTPAPDVPSTTDEQKCSKKDGCTKTPTVKDAIDKAEHKKVPDTPVPKAKKLDTKVTTEEVVAPETKDKSNKVSKKDVPVTPSEESTNVETGKDKAKKSKKQSKSPKSKTPAVKSVVKPDVDGSKLDTKNKTTTELPKQTHDKIPKPDKSHDKHDIKEDNVTNKKTHKEIKTGVDESDQKEKAKSNDDVIEEEDTLANSREVVQGVLTWMEEFFGVDSDD